MEQQTPAKFDRDTNNSVKNSQHFHISNFSIHLRSTIRLALYILCLMQWRQLTTCSISMNLN